MANPKLTIALSHYDRHVPFFDGTVQAEAIDLNVLIVGQSDRQRDGEERHERMLQKAEFDVAELSLSSYLMAKSRAMPFTAIPIFPRRLFSHSQMWINVDAASASPKISSVKESVCTVFKTPWQLCRRATYRANMTCRGGKFIGCSAKRTTLHLSQRRVLKLSGCPKAPMSVICSNAAKSPR